MCLGLSGTSSRASPAAVRGFFFYDFSLTYRFVQALPVKNRLVVATGGVADAGYQRILAWLQEVRLMLMMLALRCRVVEWQQEVPLML